MAVRTTIALALLVALAGCGTDAPADGPAPTESPSSSGGTTTGTPPATGGTLDEPTVTEPTPGLLEWRDTGVPTDTRYVKGPEWEALADAGDTQVELTRDGDAVTVRAGGGRTISEVLMSTDWAVVVRQDRAETAPSEVVAVDLATGEQRDVVTRPRRAAVRGR